MKKNNRMVVGAMCAALGLSTIGMMYSPVSVWAEAVLQETKTITEEGFNLVNDMSNSEQVEAPANTENKNQEPEKADESAKKNEETEKSDKEEKIEEKPAAEKPAEEKTEENVEEKAEETAKTPAEKPAEAQEPGTPAAEDPISEEPSQVDPIEENGEEYTLDDLIEGEQIKTYCESEEQAKAIAEAYGLTFVKFYPKTGKATFTKDVEAGSEFTDIITQYKDKENEQQFDYNFSNEEDEYDAEYYEGVIQELLEKNTEYEEANAKLTTKVADYETFSNTLKSKVVDLESQNKQLQDSIKVYAAEVESLKNKSSADIQKAINDLEKKYNAKSTSTSTTKSSGSTTSSSSKSSNSDATLNSLVSKVNSLDATTSSLSGKINSTNSDLKSLKTDMAALKSSKSSSTESSKEKKAENIKEDTKEEEEQEIQIDESEYEDPSSPVVVDDVQDDEELVVIQPTMEPVSEEKTEDGQLVLENNGQQSSEGEIKQIDENKTPKDAKPEESKNYAGLIGAVVALLAGIGAGVFFLNSKYHFIGGKSTNNDEDFDDSDYFADMSDETSDIDTDEILNLEDSSEGGININNENGTFSMDDDDVFTNMEIAV